MTSLGTKYWHRLLARALCVGFGSGLLVANYELYGQCSSPKDDYWLEDELRQVVACVS